MFTAKKTPTELRVFSPLSISVSQLPTPLILSSMELLLFSKAGIFHFLVTLALPGKKSISVNAFVDWGAQLSLINHWFIQAHHIPVIPLDKPISTVVARRSHQVHN